MNKSNEELIFEHAWKYFEKHSEQRISFFNFYIIIMGATATAISVIFKTKELSIFGVFLGLFILITTFIFWKLDERTSFLIKQAENVLKEVETKFNHEYRIFSNEETTLNNINLRSSFFTKFRTYGELFRIIYIFIGSIGLINVIYFLFSLLFK